MATTHVTIPNNPPVAVIEAMIEASLEHKNNVEKIYKSIVDHYKTLSYKHSRTYDENEISRIEVGHGCDAKSPIPFVFVQCYIGPDQTQATGFMTPDAAFNLSKSFFDMAVEAVKPRVGSGR